MVKIVLSGGGTAGHVNPLLATAHALRELDPCLDVTVVGTQEGLEHTLVPAAGFTLSTIDRVPFPRRPNKDALAFPRRWRTVQAQASELLQGADVALGFGGYVSAPMYKAARQLGIPYAIHEQNARPGLANRLGVGHAAFLGLTFASTPLKAPRGQREVIGLPLRPAIYDLARSQDRPLRREQAAQRLGLDPAMRTLLVTGGSLGAAHINEVVASCRIEGVQVLHLTGKGKDDAVREATEGRTHYHVLDYLETMEDAFAVADLVICRSGAGTVAELCAVGLPAIYVPLPIGNGEQKLNAADVVRAGGAKIVADKDFTVDYMARVAGSLLAQPDELAAMAEASAKVGKVEAASVLAQRVLALPRS